MTSIVLDPPGPLPNDYIEGLFAEELAGDLTRYLFSFHVGAGDASGRCTDVVVRIKGASLALEDPKKPGERMRR